MATLLSPPGPAADEAFTLGLAMTAAVGVAGVGVLFWIEAVTPIGALLALFLGLPVVLIVVSCLLGVWLGYNDDALARVVAGSDEPPEPQRQEE